MADSDAEPRGEPPKSKKALAPDHGAPGPPWPVEEMLRALKQGSEALERSGEMFKRYEAVVAQLEDDLCAAEEAAREAANLVCDLVAEIERVVDKCTIPIGLRLLLEEAAVRVSRPPSW